MMYFDSAAATPLDPEVFEAMKPWLSSEFANPNAVYQPAQRARAAIDEARIKVAKFLNCQPTEVYFTSSGTESNNWAIRGVIEAALSNHGLLPFRGDAPKGQRGSFKDPHPNPLLKERGKIRLHVITSSIEHSSVLRPLEYLERLFDIEVTKLSVGRDGIVMVEDFKAALRPETILASIHFVNNEIGTIQPGQEIGQICREKGIAFHTDACQAAGFFDLDVKKLNVDLLTLNAGKIYGPKGVGVLFVRDGTKISPLLHGGGQEFKMRAGTENVAGIVGMGKAVDILMRGSHREGITKLRDELWAQLQKEIPRVELNGSLEKRTPNNLNFFIPNIDADTLVKKLDLEGIAVATTAACSSSISEPSHVLKAIGLSDEEAGSSLRVSLGKWTTKEEINTFVRTLKKLIS